MSDHSELKKLAEAASKGDWSGSKSYEFMAAANPAAVLALIAEAKGLRTIAYGVSGAHRVEMYDEIVRLKAEVERLRTAEGDAMTYKAGMENCAAQRDEAKADNELLRAEIRHLISSPLYSTRMNSKRYVWLRDRHVGDDPESINLECGPSKGLNSAIDAAMSAEAKP